jgi:hypothetical protein
MQLMIRNRIIVGTAVVALGAVAAYAQVSPTAPVTPAPVAANAQPTLSLTEIEQLLKDQGVRVTELEVKDRVVEAEGYDAENREVELLVDRRTGEILSRKFDR